MLSSEPIQHVSFMLSFHHFNFASFDMPNDWFPTADRTLAAWEQRPQLLTKCVFISHNFVDGCPVWIRMLCYTKGLPELRNVQTFWHNHSSL